MENDAPLSATYLAQSIIKCTQVLSLVLHESLKCQARLKKHLNELLPKVNFKRRITPIRTAECECFCKYRRGTDNQSIDLKHCPSYMSFS